MGKGVTFDSGGLNVKSASSSIEQMHQDKTGACSSLASFLAI